MSIYRQERTQEIAVSTCHSTVLMSELEIYKFLFLLGWEHEAKDTTWNDFEIGYWHKSEHQLEVEYDPSVNKYQFCYTKYDHEGNPMDEHYSVQWIETLVELRNALRFFGVFQC